MEVALELPEAHPPQRGLWHHALTRLVRQPVTMTAFGLLVAILLVGALAPVIAPHGWNMIDLSSRWRNHGPTLAGWHLLGTDNIGRDTFVRTLYGLRTSAQTALFAAFGGTVIGVVVGSVAGSRGGWLDACLMRVADLLSAFPMLMLLYAAYILIYEGFHHALSVRWYTLLFALTLWTVVARVVRAGVVALQATEFVEAARALGASELRVFFRHVLPNVAGTIAVAATALVGQVLALEATIEFFSLGVPSNANPTLGNLIADVVAYGIGPYQQEALGWWTWVTPATVLVVVLLCVNLVGDGLDAALNPQQVRG
jgi:ABC-type dipeptide/oligopeptide/nickel transport system permease subunit